MEMGNGLLREPGKMNGSYDGLFPIFSLNFYSVETLGAASFCIVGMS